jgi:Bacteriophage protein GP30.3
LSSDTYRGCAVILAALFKFLRGRGPTLGGPRRVGSRSRTDGVGFRVTRAGVEAQSRGRGQDWSSGMLWWRGKSYDRLSDDYQGLLDRAFDALFEQAPKFRNALSATGRALLVHRLGKSDPCETILTASEFCSRLDRLRTRLHEASRR